MPTKPVKIFISYSHDSPKHSQWVLQLANTLRDEGLDCQLDQYINGFPPEGWQRWMEQQIEQADFVLIVCTPLYLQRYKGEAYKTGLGRGVNFEGVVISQHLYENYYHNTKFIPVIPQHGSHDHVPLVLKAYSSYRLMDEYPALYRLLTAQAAVLTPEIGQQKILPTNAEKNKARALPDNNIISDDSAKHWIRKISPIALISLLAFILIVGLLALSGTSNSTTGECSSVFTGDINGTIDFNCKQDQQ